MITGLDREKKRKRWEEEEQEAEEEVLKEAGWKEEEVGKRKR